MSRGKQRLQSPAGVETAFDAGVTGVIFSDSGLLAAALGDGCLQLIDMDHGVRDVPAHDGAVLCLAVDFDGDSFVTGGDDGRLVRTSADGAVTQLLSVPAKQIDVLAVSRPAKARAVAVGKEVRLLDAVGNVRARAADHPSTVAGIAFNLKGKRLAVAHYGGVTLWWLSTLGRGAKRLDWAGSHIGVSWSPDGAYVMTATQECELHGWRVTDGEGIAMRGYAAKVRSMEWLAKPLTLATSGSECVIAWPFAGSGPQGKPPLEVGQGVGPLVTQVAVHPNRPLVAAGFDDGRVAICELTADRESQAVRLRPAGGGQISALAWSRDGARLAAGSDAGALSVFALSTSVS